MIILFALYGIRRGELCALRLDSFDWEKEQLVVKRGKLYCEQLYPLVREAGDAVLLYLPQLRPQRSESATFITPKETGAMVKSKYTEREAKHGNVPFGL